MSAADISSAPKRSGMELIGHDTDSASSERNFKRRKLRKGTTSCWDCKKRKVKCTFDATSDTVCIACRRRGAACIGQDHPEDESQLSSSHGSLAGRIQRVEALLEQLLELGHNVERHFAVSALRQPNQNPTGHFSPVSECQSHYIPSNSLDASAGAVNHASSGVAKEMTDECRKLSKELLKAFPCQEDIDRFCKSDYVATFYCHQMVTNSTTRPEQDVVDFVNEIANIPDPEVTEPVLVAKRLLIFALLLMYYESQSADPLKEPPSVIMDRLVDTAVRFISTDDRGFGCIEGVECIILEGIYHSNKGNLRRAWLAFRKAMVIAQMMKMDLPKPPLIRSLCPHTRLEPKCMWFRIVHMDSFMSLLLGLPHGGQEINLEVEVPDETPICRLERYHTFTSRQIIDRNRSDVALHDLEVTKSIDKKLLEVARSMPDEFWMPPDYVTIQPNTREDFWQTMRLCHQLHHHNLIHLLHLPFLLSDEEKSRYYTYSKVSCVSACREIIKGFLPFRHFNSEVRSIYCRTADFFAFMAGMTILLAHIHGHTLEVDDWRAHQRAGDRALVEQLLEIMDKIGQRLDDSLTMQSAGSIRQLLKVESDAARGVKRCVQDAVHSLEEHSGDLQLSIPYFGIVKIGQEGITKNTPQDLNRPNAQFATMLESAHVTTQDLSAAAVGQAPYQYAQPANGQPLSELTPMVAPELPVSSSNRGIWPDLQTANFPGLAATVDDWGLQGVDAAFFDSLLKGTSAWDPNITGGV